MKAVFGLYVAVIAVGVVVAVAVALAG